MTRAELTRLCCWLLGHRWAAAGPWFGRRRVLICSRCGRWGRP